MSIFDTVAKAPTLRRNPFNRSFENKLTVEFGKLYPVLVDELVPGDKIKLSPSAVVRMMPLYTPIMQNITVDFHAFVVPYRLLAKKWKDFIFATGSDKPVMPFLNTKELLDESTIGSLLDYLGIPTDLSIADETALANFPLNIWPILAYNLIFQNEFRDEDLQPFVDPDDYNNVDDIIEYDNDLEGHFSNNEWWKSFLTLRNRAWKKDYFTSARPWPQKGVAPSLGVFSQPTANIDFIGYTGDGFVENDEYGVYWPALNLSSDYKSGSSDSLNLHSSQGVDDVQVTNSSVLGTLKGRVNLQDIQSTISADDFRMLFTLQQWLEKAAVNGNRYLEGTLGYYGVRVKDGRAQEPEFIGMCSLPVQIGEVLQTSQINKDNVLGHMGGHGYAAGYSRPFRYFATEHSCLMVLMSIRPRASYFQGIKRMWSRTDNLDYFFPDFQKLGEQAIRNMELYIDNDSGDDALETFGYQSRYAEMRSSFDEIHGDFRSSLKTWHCAREFGNKPVLNTEFIKIDAENDGLNRIFNYTEDTDKFVCQLYFDFIHKRPMKYHTRPAVIGR